MDKYTLLIRSMLIGKLGLNTRGQLIGKKYKVKEAKVLNALIKGNGLTKDEEVMVRNILDQLKYEHTVKGVKKFAEDTFGEYKEYQRYFKEELLDDLNKLEEQLRPEDYQDDAVIEAEEEIKVTGKVCEACGELKDFTEFKRNAKTKDGYRKKCNECSSLTTY